MPDRGALERDMLEPVVSSLPRTETESNHCFCGNGLATTARWAKAGPPRSPKCRGFQSVPDRCHGVFIAVAVDLPARTDRGVLHRATGVYRYTHCDARPDVIASRCFGVRRLGRT